MSVFHFDYPQKLTGHSRARSTNLGTHSEMSQKNIMAAILQTKGPIVNHQVVRGGWRFLRHLTSRPYLSACIQLQKLNLGSVITISTSQFFLKRPPVQVASILAAYPELCNLDYYSGRYFMPTSTVIAEKMRLKLINSGQVPIDLFTSHTYGGQKFI